MTLPWVQETGPKSRKTTKGVLGQPDFQRNQKGDGPAVDPRKKRQNDYKLLMATGRVKRQIAGI